jgi:hypothetical protein
LCLLQVSTYRLSSPAFPFRQSAGVYTKLNSHFFLIQPSVLPISDKLVAKSLCFRQRIVTQEVDDPWQEQQRRRGFIVFPIPDGALVYAEFIGNFLLLLAQFQPSTSKMITYCFQFFRVRGIGRPLCSEPYVAERQRRNAPAATFQTPPVNAAARARSFSAT